MGHLKCAFAEGVRRGIVSELWLGGDRLVLEDLRVALDDSIAQILDWFKDGLRTCFGTSYDLTICHPYP